MEDINIKWICKKCQYKWQGKSPKFRTIRPHCPRCGSWSVKVKDWLIDKKKWEQAKQEAIERAGWQCESCGRKIVQYAQAHHLDYNKDYYASENLVCLCSHCHFFIHQDNPSYFYGSLFERFGMILICIGSFLLILRISQNPISKKTVIIGLILFIIGIVFIIPGCFLTKETREVRKRIKTIAKGRLKS